VCGNISKNRTQEIKSNVLLSIAGTNWHIAMDQQKECGLIQNLSINSTKTVDLILAVKANMDKLRLGPVPGMSGRTQKKSEEMVRKNFLLHIWVLCNPKIGTSELHKNLFLLILNFGSSKSGKNRKSDTSLPCTTRERS
jgi:hypothetical protein